VNQLTSQPVNQPQLSLERYRVEIAMMRTRKPFDRPLRMGDELQIAALNRIAGESLFCSRCWDDPEEARWCEERELISLIGERCGACREGIYLPGAKLAARAKLQSQLAPRPLPALFAEAVG